MRDLHPHHESLAPPGYRAFKVSGHEADTYQRDDQLGMETVRPEHWLEHAFRPRRQHIEHAAGISTKPTIGSAHRDGSFIVGGRPEGGGYEARMRTTPDRPSLRVPGRRRGYSRRAF